MYLRMGSRVKAMSSDQPESWGVLSAKVLHLHVMAEFVRREFKNLDILTDGSRF